MPIDDDIDELFRLPPDRFTTARDDLAKRLKGSGEKEAAAKIKALRKPTVVAWALNRLGRSSRKDVEALIDAGEVLRAAQRKALSGAKSGEFREAMGTRRRLIKNLTNETMDILGRAGRGGQGAEDEIGRTLEAVSADRAAADQFLQGRLERPFTAVAGFDAVAGIGVIEGGGSEETEAGADRTAERKAKETAIRNAERRAEKAEADARRARIRADTLARDLDELTRRSREAEEEAEKLEGAAAEAGERLERTRRTTGAS